MKTAVATVILLLPLVTSGQEASIPKPVLEAIARDLTEMQRSIVEAQDRLLGVQSPQGWRVEAVKMTSVAPTIRIGAAQTAASLFMPKPGQTFQVVDKAADWYAVRLPEPVQGFSSGWVNAADVVLTETYKKQTSSSVSVADDVYRKLTDQVARMRDSYRDNPYVSVSGFAVNVGIPPSVSINFEFKK